MTPAPRIHMMEGRLDEFDLLTLLQTVGVGRQLVEIEVRDRAGKPLGGVTVKSGKIVAARAGDTAGVDAISALIGSPRSFQFAVFRIATDIGPISELASVSEVSVRFALGTAELRNRVVLEGALSEVDIPTLLQTMGCSRQHCAIEIYDERAANGTIFTKSGIVLSASAGQLTGIRAIQHLMSLHSRSRFRLLHLTDQIPDQVPLGPIAHVLLELDAPEPAPRPQRAPTGSPVPAPSRGARPGEPELVMEGKLTDFEIGTLLETLGATRQHARIQILDSDQGALGEITLKAGWVLSSQIGALRGRDALVVLLGVSSQLRFRVLTGIADREPPEPLGAIHALLAELRPDRAPRRAPTTRGLRWAIPVSFLVGGAIAFLVLHFGGARPPAPDDPAVVSMKTQPGETLPPTQATPVQPAPPAPEATPPQAAPQRTTEAATPSAPSAETSAQRAEPTPSTAPPHEPSAPPAQRADRAPSTPPAQPTPSSEPSAPRSAGPPATDAPAPPPPQPRVGPSIRTAQVALRRLGFDPGPIDSYFGRQTRSAVIRFQRSQRLPLTGVLDQGTWTALVAQLTR